MLVDKKKYKELIKEAGGISKLECALTIIVKDGLGLQNNKSCNFNIYPNGLYFNFVFGKKMYFSMSSIKEMKCINRIIEIYIENEEVIKLEIERGADIIKVYNIIVDYAGLMVEKLTDVEKNEKELNKIRKKEEAERKRKEYERIMASNPEVTIKANTKTNTKASAQKELEYKRIMASNPIVSTVTQSGTIDNVARCPKCGSTSITANKKGFSLAKGAAGVVAVGALGAVAAGHGKNKVIITCLKCGHQWKPGKK